MGPIEAPIPASMHPLPPKDHSKILNLTGVKLSLYPQPRYQAGVSMIPRIVFYT